MTTMLYWPIIIHWFKMYKKALHIMPSNCNIQSTGSMFYSTHTEQIMNLKALFCSSCRFKRSINSLGVKRQTGGHFIQNDSWLRLSVSNRSQWCVLIFNCTAGSPLAKNQPLPLPMSGFDRLLNAVTTTERKHSKEHKHRLDCVSQHLVFSQLIVRKETKHLIYGYFITQIYILLSEESLKPSQIKNHIMALESLNCFQSFMAVSH